MIKIDLRSDTLTRPSPEMIRVMSQAEVGDDAYGEDKHVAELEEFCADYFGKPAALFMPSGTMSNQVALRAFTGPGSEVICDVSYHINFFESAQAADLGKVVLNPVRTANGILTDANIKEAIEQKARWNDNYATASLIWLENSIAAHGGRVFPLDVLQQLSIWCKSMEIPIFIDGARILNASIAAGISPFEYAVYADALTMCFSKGLGAPFGSILVGNRHFIARARRFRKWYGGALHQSGFMAAAALYAIKNNVGQLVEDHSNAALFSNILQKNDQICVKNTETNIILFDVANLGTTSAEFVRLANQEGVQLLAWRETEVRAMTSSNVNRSQIIEAGDRLLRLANSIGRSQPTHTQASAQAELVYI